MKLAKIVYMRYFHAKLKKHLDSMNPKMSFTKLQFLSGIPSGQFSHWKKPKEDKNSRTPTDTELEKLASVPELGLALGELRAWRAIDIHGEQTILDAAVAQFPADTKLGKELRELLNEARNAG